MKAKVRINPVATADLQEIKSYIIERKIASNEDKIKKLLDMRMEGEIDKENYTFVFKTGLKASKDCSKFKGNSSSKD